MFLFFLFLLLVLRSLELVNIQKRTGDFINDIVKSDITPSTSDHNDIYPYYDSCIHYGSSVAGNWRVWLLHLQSDSNRKNTNLYSFTFSATDVEQQSSRNC